MEVHEKNHNNNNNHNTLDLYSAFLPRCSQSAHAAVLCVSRCILATDMARHNEILNKFKATLPVFDFKTEGHKEVVRRIPRGVTAQLLAYSPDIHSSCKNIQPY